MINNMIYLCKLCNYQTIRLYDFRVHTKSLKHLKRKDMYSNDEQLLENYHNSEITENQIEYETDPNIENQIEYDKVICKEIEKKPTKIHLCHYCKKEFSCNQNVIRHKKTCKYNKNNSTGEITVALNEFDELKKDTKLNGEICGNLIKIINPDPMISHQPNKVLKLVKNLTDAKQADIMSKILLSSFGIVYLVQPENYLNTNVYKIGMSDKPLIDRIKSYGSQSRVLFLMECNMAYELEQEIIKAFKQKFKIHKGKEYFEGIEFEMTSVFMQLCVTHKLTNCIGKDTALLNNNQITH